MDNPTKGFHCGQCGKFASFGVWLYAHWNIHVVHTCDCGARTELYAGKPLSLRPPRAFHLAVGLWLDNYGDMYGIKRRQSEPDEAYRTRMVKDLQHSHNYPMKGSK